MIMRRCIKLEFLQAISDCSIFCTKEITRPNNVNLSGKLVVRMLMSRVWCNKPLFKTAYNQIKEFHPRQNCHKNLIKTFLNKVFIQNWLKFSVTSPSKYFRNFPKYFPTVLYLPVLPNQHQANFLMNLAGMNNHRQTV
jgi:hypothetical protein